MKRRYLAHCIIRGKRDTQTRHQFIEVEGESTEYVRNYIICHYGSEPDLMLLAVKDIVEMGVDS